MYNFAIVGAGAMAELHADSITKCPTAKLVAVADINLNNAKRLAEPFGAIVYEDYTTMDTSGIDVVMLNLPHYLHCEASCFFLNKGVNVYVEKPMAMSARECDRMIAASKSGSAILMIGHVQQYANAHQKLKQIIEDKTLGRLLRITEVRNANYFVDRPKWFLNKSLSGGGIVMNYCAHTLDKIFYLTEDEVTNIVSVCSNFVNDYDVEEGAQVLAKFKSGMSASITFTGTDVAPDYITDFYFEHGEARVIGGVDLSIYQNGIWHDECKDDGKMFVRVIEAIANRLAGKPSMVTTPEHGRMVIDAIEKLYKNQI